jgi:hypothetical protein
MSSLPVAHRWTDARDGKKLWWQNVPQIDETELRSIRPLSRAGQVITALAGRRPVIPDGLA